MNNTSGRSEFGRQTALDIAGQGTAWLSVNRRLRSATASVVAAWNELDIEHVHVIGCGSVHFLSATLASLLQSDVGVSATSSSGAALLRPEGRTIVAPERTLLIAMSRSGETSEVVRAVGQFRAGGGKAVWGITTRSQSSLAGLVDLLIAEDDGYESSVVQTRSFSSLLGMAQGLVRVIAGQPLTPDDQVEQAIAQSLSGSNDLVAQIEGLATIQRIVVLGSGALFGLAQEGQLLMNEMALTDSSAHEVLDFLHGPISMVDDQTLVVALLDARPTEHELGVLERSAKLGARVVTLATGSAGPSGHPSLEIDPLGTQLLALYLPPLQMISLHRATLRGIDPDQPRHLSAVVVLDQPA